MLAEIFLLRMEAIYRASKESAHHDADRAGRGAGCGRTRRGHVASIRGNAAIRSLSVRSGHWLGGGTESKVMTRPIRLHGPPNRFNGAARAGLRNQRARKSRIAAAISSACVSSAK